MIYEIYNNHFIDLDRIESYILNEHDLEITITMFSSNKLTIRLFNKDKYLSVYYKLRLARKHISSL